jgi:hypothetical protein
VTDLAGASATQMASHRRATMTDGEIDGAVQLPPLTSPLHIQHTPVTLVALTFHSATVNVQINPSQKISCLVGSVSNSILHFIVLGISQCSTSLTHKTHVCSITKIDWLTLVTNIFAIYYVVRTVHFVMKLYNGQRDAQVF